MRRVGFLFLCFTACSTPNPANEAGVDSSRGPDAVSTDVPSTSPDAALEAAADVARTDDVVAVDIAQEISSPDAAVDVPAPPPDVVSMMEAGAPRCPVAPRDLPSIQRTTRGRYTTLANFPATRLGNRRTVTVYVPEGAGPFPVLYAHDGQNLFDPARSAFGVDWGVDEATTEVEREGLRYIVVGIDNTSGRTTEYTPVADPQYGGGRADDYLDFIVNELKPFIDANFPTRCDRDSTAMMGSSLGGLVSFYAARRFPEVFGRIAALSPSFWWNNRWTISTYNSAAPGSDPLRLWLDGGSAEGERAMDGTSSVIRDIRAVRDRALSRGLIFNRSLGYLEAEHMPHNEFAWRQRMPSVLRFLFGPENPAPAAGYVWAAKNPVTAGANSTAVLQLSFADGRRMTVPGSLAMFTVMGGAYNNEVIENRSSAGSSVQISARYGSITGTGTLRIEISPQNFIERVFEVRAPAMTDRVAISGSTAELTMWGAMGIGLVRMSETSYRGSFVLPVRRAIEYKFNRGSWETVEVTASGGDMANRTDDAAQSGTSFETIARWRDR